MGPLDLFWHVANLFALPVLFGLVVALGAKLAWRHVLQAVPWFVLAARVGGSAALVTLAGLAVFGRDGRMLTYALMVLAGAAALAWTAWRR